nr:hypothetical protein [Pantoea sp. BAV 3049]
MAKGSGFYWKRIMSDTGQVNLYHFGAKGDDTVMTGSMKEGGDSGYKLTTTSTTDTWYRIGKFAFPKVNPQWMLEIVSKLSTANPSGTAANPGSVPCLHRICQRSLMRPLLEQ